MTIGAKLKTLREDKGYMQRDVARILEIAPNTLSGYERDTRTPDAMALKKLANFYNVTVDFLVDNEMDVNESTEKRIKILARKADNLTKEEREKLINNFEETINIYLNAKKYKD